jgi:hypothetical protein
MDGLHWALYVALSAPAVAATLAGTRYAAGWRPAVLCALAATVAAVASREPLLAWAFGGSAAFAAWRRRRGAPLLHGLDRELVLVGIGFGLYELGRVLLRGDAESAMANARHVIGFQEALHIDVEYRLQSWLGSGATGHLLNEVYSFVFHPVPIVAMLVFFAVDRKGYRVLRDALGVSIVLALILIALFPVAPPRLMPELNIVDTIAEGGRARVLANQYAAIPSLHVGWLALVGFMMAVRGGRVMKLLAPIPAVLMTLSVVATGNHYLVDPIIGSTISVGPALVLLWLRKEGRRPLLRRAPGAVAESP